MSKKIDLGQFFRDCELHYYLCSDGSWNATLSLPTWATPELDEISREMRDMGRRLGNVWMRQESDGLYWNEGGGKSPQEAVRKVWEQSVASLAPYIARLVPRDPQQMTEAELIAKVEELQAEIDALRDS